MRMAIAVLASVFCTPLTGLCQSGVKEPAEPFGRMYAPRVFGLGTGSPGFQIASADGASRTFHWFASPLLVDIDQGTVFGGTLGYKGRFGSETGVPWQLKASYSHVRLRGGADGIDRFSGNLKSQIFTSKDDRTSVAAIADYRVVRERSSQVEITLAADHVAWLVEESGSPRPLLVVSANLAWTREDPREGPTRSGFQPTAGLTVLVRPTFWLNGEYSIDTEIAGDDSYSFAAILVLPTALHRTQLIGGYQKADTVFLNMVVPF